MRIGEIFSLFMFSKTFLCCSCLDVTFIVVHDFTSVVGVYSELKTLNEIPILFVVLLSPPTLVSFHVCGFRLHIKLWSDSFAVTFCSLFWSYFFLCTRA